MKVIGYIRVSTDQQENSGLGLEAQEAKIRSYCGLYDLELVSICQDAASGKSLNRDGLKQALDTLKNGKAEGLIVAKLDRLTRSVKDLGTLLEETFSKFSLFVVAEQVDTRTAAGRLVLNLLTSVAQWERETIGERTRDALKAKRNRGEKTGGDVPFGYRLVDGRALEEDPKEQAVINQIAALRGKGFGYKSISKALNSEGITTKTGKEWSGVLVKKLIDRVSNG